MIKKTIKIISLNLWRYYGNWEKRKKNIIKYLIKEKPDIVFFQECFDDGRHNGANENQAKQLNDKLKFKHCIYSVAEMLRTENKEVLKTSVFDGLGCLSKIPVINVKSIRLKQNKEDKHFRIIQRVVTKVSGEKVVFFHTHFSNRDDWAKLHLKETIQIADKEKIKPIIVGDLNIRVTDDLIEIGKDYRISWVEKKYLSYPSKDEVLDYVLLPKKFKFLKIECDGDGLSDHRPLVTHIC